MTKKLEGIKIAGHKGTWYSVDRTNSRVTGGALYLMEHETYGDEADHNIINGEQEVILENVQNGFADYFSR